VEGRSLGGSRPSGNRGITTVLTIKSNTQVMREENETKDLNPETVCALNELFQKSYFQFTGDKKMSKKVCVVLIRGNGRMGKSRVALSGRVCRDKRS
jgi:hypothetical protein